jgi:hypothetical protein
MSPSQRSANVGRVLTSARNRSKRRPGNRVEQLAACPAEDAGFARVHLGCHIDLGPSSFWRPVSIDALLDSSPNPLAPTVRETIAHALTADEQHRFVMHLADAIALDDRVHRSAGAHLSAVV